jgi:hypothetical protein
MPGRNGMGPRGQGSRTGGGRGRGGNFDGASDRLPQQPGYGMGRGGRGGMRRRRQENQAWPAPSWASGMEPAANRPTGFPQRGGVVALKEHVALIERGLDELKARIREIESATPAPTGKDRR